MAGVEPSECWHIRDDFEADLKGSLSVGMRGIWLKRNSNDSVQDFKIIESLSELNVEKINYA